jgi:biotin carboxyl carrier protein
MGTDERAPGDRRADHEAIDALANELIPALIAKLGASGLGEIEVREGDWKVRLRRPADGAATAGGRRSGRSATAQPVRPALTPVGPGRGPAEATSDEADVRATGATIEPDLELGESVEVPVRTRDPFRSIATSPAVGFFQPRPGIVPGARVRAGDPIGSIDVLGVPTEVVAPADGIVGASLVEPGEAVEYGQELVWVELLSGAPAAGEGSQDGAGSAGGGASADGQVMPD